MAPQPLSLVSPATPVLHCTGELDALTAPALRREVTAVTERVRGLHPEMAA